MNNAARGPQNISLIAEQRHSESSITEVEEAELESSVTGNSGLKMGAQVVLRAQAHPLFLVPFHYCEAYAK